MRNATSGVHLVTAWRPLASTLAAFPAVCFSLALLTDIAYWRSPNLQWQNFSAWLLFAGLVVGGFVLLAEIVGLLFRSRLRTRGPGWLHAVGLLVVLVLGVLNSFVHARDGWTAVVPQGLILSASMIIILAITGWIGHASTSRGRVEVAYHG